MAKAKDMGRWMAERTIDAQRASATVRVMVHASVDRGAGMRMWKLCGGERDDTACG